MSVATEPDAIVTQVADNGPRHSRRGPARMLQPFVRLERDREQVGSGLGLSLVAAVMRLHRGSIELLDNNPGWCRALQVAGRRQTGLRAQQIASTAQFPSFPGTLHLHPELSRSSLLRRVLTAENAALLSRCRLADAAELNPLAECRRSPAS